MNIFLTGATGYLGSAIAQALLVAGHRVTGLARTPESARQLDIAGISPLRGLLEEQEQLVMGARGADGVIHAAFDRSAQGPHLLDNQVMETFLRTLSGSGKVLVYTSGLTVLGNTGKTLVDEETPASPVAITAWRPALEQRVLAAASLGVRSVVIRPGWVYGRAGGVLRQLVDQAKRDGIARPVGDGRNAWPVVHVEDLARLYALAVERAPAGTLVHAVGGTVAMTEIAAAASRAAGGPGRVEPWPLQSAHAQIGPFAEALALDQHVHSRKAERLLGWKPGALSVLDELEQGSYAMSRRR